MAQFKNLTGQRFGKLVAIRPVGKTKHKHTIWECQCDCGNTAQITSSNLKNRTKSCGCYVKHGMCGTRTYMSWQSMVQRCENPNATGYECYGGRGIKICKQWHDFENFYKDMGKRPPHTTLERKNNDKGYSPSNCKWATRAEQCKNRRPQSCGPNRQFYFIARKITGCEQYLSNNQSEFAKKWGLTISSISGCLKGRLKQHKGWVFQKAIRVEEMLQWI